MISIFSSRQVFGEMEFFQEEHDTTPLLPKENVVESKEDKSKRAKYVNMQHNFATKVVY